MVGRSRITGYRGVGITALIGVALLLAACGSSSSSSTTGAAAGTSPSSSSSSAPGTGVKVTTAKNSLGTYLTAVSGRALYVWLADSNDKSSCNGACAAAWPPLLTQAAPTASGGAVAADLGLITRSDGTKQVTYKGHPLYYYVGDPGPGTTTGNGSNQFGAKWWLISPAGSQVGASAAKSSSAASTSSSGSSGSSSGGGGWG
jgi:predicted lipoprotein with Yx(FWY)xxD motif